VESLDVAPQLYSQLHPNLDRKSLKKGILKILLQKNGLGSLHYLSREIFASGNFLGLGLTRSRSPTPFTFAFPLTLSIEETGVIEENKCPNFFLDK